MRGRQRETTSLINELPRCMVSQTKKSKICSLRSGTLRLLSELSTTEEETRTRASTGNPGIVTNEGARPKPKGRLEPDKLPGKASSSLKENQFLRIGTWNARTMLKKGKLENVKLEMRKMNVNILGLSEVRWKDGGDFMSDDFQVSYAGGSDSQRGVAVILDRDVAKRVTKVIQHSDRLLLVKVQAEPVDLVIIQVYMPTADHAEDEVEGLYEELEELIAKEKGKDYLIIMGDWNAVVGEGRDEKEVGSFGLGKRNDRGQMLLEFCRRRNMMITNTWFDHNNRRRYTWKKPGDTGRYQLDYILVRQRYRSSVKNATSYPGADIDSDHNLVMMTVKVKLKKIQRGQRVQKWRLEGIEGKAVAFQKEIAEMLAGGSGDKGRTVEEDWTELRDAVKKSAEATIGYQNSRKAKKPWVSEKMIMKMNERRRWKNVDTEEGRVRYRKLNNELRRETDKARENWWMEACEELEEMDKRGRSDLMYVKVKEITRTKKTGIDSSIAIKDVNGGLLSEPEEVRNRWKEYIGQLYCGCDKPKLEELGIELEMDVEDDEKGPELIEQEVRTAIKDMKKGKALGPDGIPAELLKISGEEAYEHLERICQKMYESGTWPEDFTKVVMIPLKKKQNATDCEDHRTISLISHASKIMLRILTRRIEAKANDFIGKNQFGFRKGCGTRDAIGVLRMLCQRSVEIGNEVYICFVDFEKAFDRVNWVKMMEVLKKIGVDWRDRRMISSLYMKQSVTVRVAGECSEPSLVGRGVRQGCCLSPLLFNVYAEMMMLEAMEEIEEGVKVGGKLLKDIRFADDQGMVAGSELGLQKLMDGLVRAAKQYDMKINVKKTKVMRVSRTGEGEINIFIEGQRVEQVSKFKYLGSLITADGKCEEEIKSRIGIAKDAFSKRKELLTQKMSRSVKKKIVKTIVWSVALYGAETWTLRKEDERRLNALEMWLWRRMEKISWKAKRTNESVLELVGERRQLLDVIVQRKKNWIGHVLRGDGLMREVMEGKMEGKRPKGRPRIGMLEELLEDSFGNMKRRAENRLGWKCWMPRTCRKTEHS